MLGLEFALVLSLIAYILSLYLELVAHSMLGVGDRADYSATCRMRGITFMSIVAAVATFVSLPEGCSRNGEHTVPRASRAIAAAGCKYWYSSQCCSSFRYVHASFTLQFVAVPLSKMLFMQISLLAFESQIAL